MAFSGGAARGGWSYPPVLTKDLMSDPRTILSLPEYFNQGVGKAHRHVPYCNYEMRNYRRTAGIPSPKVEPE